MLHVGKDAAYIYVFIKIMPALALVTFAVTDNDIIVGEPPKGIVSEATYAALVLAAAQARRSCLCFGMSTPEGTPLRMPTCSFDTVPVVSMVSRSLGV